MTLAGGASATADERLALVRAHDLDRYISILLSPAETRADLLTLHAFDAELARIPATVTDPLIGEIRLQWWRDALAPLLRSALGGTRQRPPAGHRTGHPVADDLFEVVDRRRLSAGLLHGMIDARSTELSDAPLADEAQLMAYIAKTDAALLQLTARVLDGNDPPASLDTGMTDAAGRTIGLVRLARRLLLHAKGAEILVPSTLWPLADRAGNGPPTGLSARQRAAERLAGMAVADLERVHSRLVDLPRAIQPAFLPLALAPRYIALLRRAGSDGHAPADINPLIRLWTLWRARHKKIMV